MGKRRRSNRSRSTHRVLNATRTYLSMRPQFEFLEPRHLLSAAAPDGEIGTLRGTSATTDAYGWPYRAVVGRHLFYNDSGTASPLRCDGSDPAINEHDDLAIATNKAAYLPGSGAATFANVSSYTKGINGLMIDITYPLGDIGVDDFEFYTGNDDHPGEWEAAPPPSSLSVRTMAGVSGSDRVEMIWGSEAVRNGWLLVIVRANEDTGLSQKAGWRVGIGDVFFFGNAVGDSGAGDNVQFAFVNQTDELAARNNPATVHSNIPITNLFDYNRDGAVNLSDSLVARNNPTNIGNALRFISVGNPFTAPVVFDPPDIDLDGLEDDSESTTPGRVVVVSPEGISGLMRLTVQPLDDYAGEDLKLVFDPAIVQVYRNNSRDYPIGSGFQVTPGMSFYAEVVASGSTIVQLDRSIGSTTHSDKIRLTGISIDLFEMDSPSFVSADEHRVLVALALRDMDDENIRAAVEARDISFSLYRNGAPAGSVTRSIVGGGVAASIATGSSVSDTYKVVASLAGGTIESPEMQILAGAPHSISYTLSKPSYVADGTDRIEITATIRDAHGNLVEDNTTVNWAIEGYGRRFVGTHPNETATVGGIVRATVLAPEVPGTQKIKIRSGQATATITIEVDAVAAYIDTPSSLNVNTGQSGQLTVQTNAADGTQVYWTLSNGGVRTYVSTVINGESSIPIHSSGGRIGGCIVTATIGSYMSVAQFTFASDAPLQIRLSRPVISGDVASDGFATVVHGAAEPLAFAPAVVQPRSVQVPYYAQTDVYIQGQPGRTYLVDFENPLVSAPLARLLGLDVHNRITLNSYGQGQFILGSQGTLSGDLLAYEAADVRLRVRPVNLANPLEPDLNGPVAVATATYVHHGLLTYSTDAVMSFFGADPITGLGLATSFAGGIAGVGDIGALVKNAARGLGFSDVDPNYLESSLAGLGLATEAAVIYGELPDSGISALKSLAAALGDAQAGKVLGLLWHRVLTNLTDSLKFLQFVTHIARDTSGFAFQVLKEVLTEEDVMLAAMRSSDEYGAVIFAGLKSVSESPAFGGKAAAQQIVRSLDTLQGNARQYFKGLSGADLERVFEHLGVILQAGKIDAAMVERLLSFDELYSAGYTRMALLADLRLVANADGLNSLAKQICNNTTNFRVGHLYELQSASKILQENGGTNIQFLVRISNEEGRTDIDYIIDGVYYQAKSGWGGETEAKAWKWIAKARADGATTIRYVAPGGRTGTPADILLLLENPNKNGWGQAIEILDIPKP